MKLDIASITDGLGGGKLTGNDVYVVGYEDNIGKVWKNGEVLHILTANDDVFPKSIFVVGNDVYVAGYKGSNRSRKVARFWKNGVEQNLTDETNESEATSVYVSGNDVYVAGNDGKIPKLWKNGSAQDLITKFGGRANSVFVSGNDVYVAGIAYEKYSGSVVILWKNGVAQNITEATYREKAIDSFNYDGANSVYVLDKDVYVAGWKFKEGERGNRVAMLWKNGKAQNLTNGIDQGEALSVFVK